MKLSNDCNKKKCRVPVDCERNNAVYNILHFLIDVGSVKENVSDWHRRQCQIYLLTEFYFSLILIFQNSDIFVAVSMIFAPIAKSTKALPLYYNIQKG